MGMTIFTELFSLSMYHGSNLLLVMINIRSGHLYFIMKSKKINSYCYTKIAGFHGTLPTRTKDELKNKSKLSSWFIIVHYFLFLALFSHLAFPAFILLNYCCEMESRSNQSENYVTKPLE